MSETVITYNNTVMSFGSTPKWMAVESDPYNPLDLPPYLALTYLIYSPVTVHEPGMVYYNGCMVAGPSGCYFTGKG